MHRFANPAQFLRIAKPLTPALFWPGFLLVVGACVWGLNYTPTERLMGDTVGASERRKGKRAEQDVAKYLRDHGYEAVTTRAASGYQSGYDGVVYRTPAVDPIARTLVQSLVRYDEVNDGD